ncbi:phosphoglucosamine mutase [Rickettsiales endosymbiont of Peranema trichophorum]|uniref:phosphoglucosamine mutase n=1 Tax=Rickettsiales endosymbiont of Peranema trichophorum TaxID=2486577 RepID=UPI001022D1FF|nr:phosphoglucosamine mutase [Rickettsiales endosymbiont of Peranema trichophorum]RZI46029.1 phosphoglucosamine mutase [Rickettsiales endosymbiont of Peranema trichophorum]
MTVKLFGTDGIRGPANQYPMTADIALKFAIAAGVYYKQDGHKNRVVIGKDTRLSGYLLEPALTAGFISVGVDVILVGPIPTPAISMLVKALRADFGVMITASHNPYYDNGLKLFNKNGEKLLNECENKIQTMILDDDINKYLVQSDQLGRARRLEDAPGRYIEHVKSSVTKSSSLSGLRVVLDTANGAAYHLAPTILWELGAEVVPIAAEPNGFNINAACGATAPEVMAIKVKELRADIGIALDGDGDRLVVVTEQGKIVHGDIVIGMIAKGLLDRGRLIGGAIVVTEMSNTALCDYLDQYGIKTIRTAVGDRNVREAMLTHGTNFGGEQSGHIIMGDYATTGDGIVAALQMLLILVESGKKLSELVNIFEPYPQVLRSLKFQNNNPLEHPKVIEKLSQIQSKHSEQRVSIRASGTEKVIRIMVEGKEETWVHDTVEEIEKLLTDHIHDS